MALVFGAVLGAAGCSSSGSPGKPTPLGTPGGTVTVRSGNKVVCVITLNKNGTGTCKVSTAGDAAGHVTYTGTYTSTTGLKAGSATATLTVLPPKPAGPAASPAGSSAS